MAKTVVVILYIFQNLTTGALKDVSGEFGCRLARVLSVIAMIGLFHSR